MNTENIITGTWLPVFPGFYGTFFDGENMYEQEIDFINERVEPKELAEAMIENLYNSDAGRKLWKDYTESTAKQCVTVIEQSLKELGFVESIVFEEISSPREYNFANDAVHTQVTFTPVNLQNIRHFISEHFAQWKEYLKGSYTSYDGFTSHHSNQPGAEEWFVDNAIRQSHNAGSVLEFLCGELEINSEMLYYECENDAGLDHEEYKKECIKMGWWEPKSICKDWFKSLIPRLKLKYRLTKFKDSNGIQLIFNTPKQTYILAITKLTPDNSNFVLKRLSKNLLFGMLKKEKEPK